jgi:hypothetical protein
LHGNDVLQAVTAVRRSREAQEVAGGRLADARLERGCRQVVALVHDDEAVAGKELGKILTAHEALDRGQIYYPTLAVPTAADLPYLPGLEAQQSHQLRAPLFQDRLAVRQYFGANVN